MWAVIVKWTLEHSQHECCIFEDFRFTILHLSFAAYINVEELISESQILNY
jgi:hypothetical protein